MKKTAYEQYMDRQSVSEDLHSKLMSLERDETVHKSTGKVVTFRWRSAAALAASLALAVGLGIWVSQSGLLRMGRASGSQAEAAVAQTAQDEEEWADQEPEAVNSAEEPMMDAAPAESESDSKSGSFVAEHMIEAEEQNDETGNRTLTQRNADFLADALAVNRSDGLLDAAGYLEEAGCGLLVTVEVTQENEQTRLLTLTDEQGKTFTVTANGQGVISSIRDEDATEWYFVTE